MTPDHPTPSADDLARALREDFEAYLRRAKQSDAAEFGAIDLAAVAYKTFRRLKPSPPSVPAESGGVATENKHVTHLNDVIDHLKTMRAAVIRGYIQATEELEREGDSRTTNWLGAVSYLRSRIASFDSPGTEAARAAGRLTGRGK